MKKNSWLSNLLRKLGLPVLLVLLYASLTWEGDYLFAPSIDQIGAALIAWASQYWRSDILVSLGNLSVGYLIACVLGVGGGLIIGLNERLRMTFEPVIHFLRSIPPIALIPIYILVIGIGTSMRISIIATGALFPILLSTIDAVRGMEPTYLDVVRSYRLPLKDRIFRVMLPASLPQILAGMKISLTMAVILIVASEFQASTQGIGNFLVRSERTFDIPSIWAGTFFLGLVGYLLSMGFEALERRLVFWQRNEH